MAGPVEQDLIDFLAALSLRPYDFVCAAFPWGEPGTELEHRTGPVGWQAETLQEMQELMLGGTRLEEALQFAIKSGHDIGKTAFLCWVIIWAMSTREDTRGRATANTERQLRTILWGELAKWHRLFVGKDLFKHTATAYYSTDPDREKTWRFDAIPWSEDNPEAFAGLHNHGKRIVLIFDEASGIHDKIWETTDGVVNETDTEIIWIATSNPTKNHGRFYECFNRFAGLWHHKTVDSRTVPFTNKNRINQAIDAWGLDSDYVKVRFLGEFPAAGSTQLISIADIRAGRLRRAVSQPTDPLILSVDVARFGMNESVAGFRRGKDAKSIPASRWRGLSVVDLAGRVAALIGEHQPDAVFVDEGGVGGGVVDVLRSLGHAVIGVNFGSSASSRPGGSLVGNKRAEMYVALRNWLAEGGAIEDADDLEDQLIAIEYFFNKKSEIMLVAKEDMEAEGHPSPDWADMLAMTFAFQVTAKRWRQHGSGMQSEYNPLAYATTMDRMGDTYGGWH